MTNKSQGPLLELLVSALRNMPKQDERSNRSGARSKGKRGPGPVKSSDEIKAANAAAHAEAAEALFAKKGYKNNVARITIRSFGLWEQVGRRVKKGEKSLRVKMSNGRMGPPLFHLDQTDVTDAKVWSIEVAKIKGEAAPKEKPKAPVEPPKPEQPIVPENKTNEMAAVLAALASNGAAEPKNETTEKIVH